MPTLEKVQIFQAKTRKKEPINYNVFDWQLQILPATVALIILDKILVHYFSPPHINSSLSPPASRQVYSGNTELSTEAWSKET